jgi:methyl-accepting chemotaxis protein
VQSPNKQSTNTPVQPNTIQPTKTVPTRKRIGWKLLSNHDLLLSLPIGSRLTLSFLLAALIAALVTGIIGIQRTQILSRQSNFYQQLLQTNTSLTTGENFLQLMDTETHTLIDDATVPEPSQDTLSLDRAAIQNLSGRYDTILSNFINQDLLVKHPDEVALLSEIGQERQADQQRTLAAGAQRSWLLYLATQNQIILDITSGNISEAQPLLRAQAEPTNADALSALESLIQQNQILSSSVGTAARSEEQNQTIGTIIGAILASLAIAFVGWFISRTLIHRLRHLQQVTSSIKLGQLNTRATITGRDEITDVAEALNAMLEVITGLIEETRNQRDVLTNAAQHLFSHMRIVSARDLSITTSIVDDPIDMLANAFNFTISRFQRFLLRMQASAKQLDVIARQELERSETFAATLNFTQNSAYTGLSTPGIIGAKDQGEKGDHREVQSALEREVDELTTLITSIREHQHTFSSTTFPQSINNLLALIDEMVPAVRNLANSSEASSKDLRILRSLFQRLNSEVQNIQQNTSWIFIRLDKDLTGLINNLSRLKTKVSISGLPSISEGWMPELARQGKQFVTEIVTLARQLHDLVQEMDRAIGSFQLDTQQESDGKAKNSISHSTPNRLSNTPLPQLPNTPLPQLPNTPLPPTKSLPNSVPKWS